MFTNLANYGAPPCTCPYCLSPHMFAIPLPRGIPGLPGSLRAAAHIDWRSPEYFAGSLGPVSAKECNAQSEVEILCCSLDYCNKISIGLLSESIPIQQLMLHFISI